jgi:TRAP-type C4-dicarboxylate transport system substrate-binding protein
MGEFDMLRPLAAAALALSFVPGLAPARADEPYVMKITLPTINDAPYLYVKEFADRVAKASNGRIKPEIYPVSQLGSIPRQIEGVQFGSIQVAEIPPEFFVGIDERFEVMAAPGLVDSLEQAQRLADDPEVRKLMLGLGAEKGLHGAAIFPALPSSIIARTPIRHLADFKGKKIRIFASDFQKTSFERLGATPVAMSLGDVLPALNQGTIDGAIAGITVFTAMKYQDAAKYVTETGQPYIFLVLEFSKKWYEALPKDLQQILSTAATEETQAIKPTAISYFNNAASQWKGMGGELIDLPPDEQASMMKTLSGIAEEVSQHKPGLAAAYGIVSEAAKRTR